MRPYVLPIFAVVVLAAAAALAVQQSPNFTSIRAELSVLTADTPYYRYVNVPLPYREPQRFIQPPLPEERVGTMYGNGEPEPRTAPVTSLSGTAMEGR